MNLDQLQQYADALQVIYLISPIFFSVSGGVIFLVISAYVILHDDDHFKLTWIGSLLIAVGMGVFLFTVYIPNTQTETQFKTDLKTAISERYNVEVSNESVNDLIGDTQKFYDNVKGGGNVQLGSTSILNNDNTVQNVEMWKTKNDRFTLVTSGANKKELPVKN